MDKKIARTRRSRQTRLKIVERKATRLAVHRSNQHVYAQVIDASGAKILASASTLEKEVRAQIGKGSGIKAAQEVGKRIAEKAKQLGIAAVAFDRSGFRYHGRIKAVAEAARENGLKF